MTDKDEKWCRMRALVGWRSSPSACYGSQHEQSEVIDFLRYFVCVVIEVCMLWSLSCTLMRIIDEPHFVRASAQSLKAFCLCLEFQFNVLLNPSTHSSLPFPNGSTVGNGYRLALIVT